jgi:multiple sugar transport system substrate-binding protein
MLTASRIRFAGLAAAFVIAAVTVAACGDDDGDGGTGDVTSLSVVAQAGGPGDAVEELADDYEEETGVAVDVTLLPYENVRERALTDFTRGSASFDVVAFDYLWGKEYADGGFLVPIDDLVDENADEVDIDDFFASYIEYAKQDDQLYGLPWLGAVYMMFYREDLLEESNLEPPQTWDDYAKAAETLQRDHGMSGSTFIGKRDDPLVNEFATIAWSYGGNFNEGTEATMNSSENLEAFELWGRVLETAPADSLAVDWPVAASQFAEGQAAMMLNYSDTAETVLAEKAVADDVGFARVPEGPDGEATPALGGWAMGINADSDKQEAAFDYITWLLSAETQEKGLRYGGSPTRASVLEDPALEKRYPYFPAAAENYEAGHEFPKATNWVEWEAAMGPPMSDALGGQISLKEGLDEAQKDVAPLVPEGISGD